jgi:outer membrane murein-binding lipoprotein Lpp
MQSQDQLGIQIKQLNHEKKNLANDSNSMRNQ